MQIVAAHPGLRQATETAVLPVMAAVSQSRQAFESVQEGQSAVKIRA